MTTPKVAVNVNFNIDVIQLAWLVVFVVVLFI